MAIGDLVKFTVVNDAVSSGVDNIVTAELSLNDADLTGGASLAISAIVDVVSGTKIGAASNKCAHTIVW